MSYKMHSPAPRRRWRKRGANARRDAIIAHVLALPFVLAVIVAILVALRLAWPSW